MHELMSGRALMSDTNMAVFTYEHHLGNHYPRKILHFKRDKKDEKKT